MCVCVLCVYVGMCATRQVADVGAADDNKVAGKKRDAPDVQGGDPSAVAAVTGVLHPLQLCLCVCVD